MASRNKHDAPSDGRFAYDGLDRAIHEKARLGILTSLVAHPNGLLFSDLKELCSLTDGNLNRHLAVLEEERTRDDQTVRRPRPPANRRRHDRAAVDGGFSNISTCSNKCSLDAAGSREPSSRPAQELSLAIFTGLVYAL